MVTRRIPRTARALFSPEHRPQTFTSSPSQIRTLFKVPQLHHKQDERYSTEGITREIETSEGPKSIRLYSGAGFRMAWTTHQSHLLYNLNYLTMSEPESQAKNNTLDLAKQHARDPNKAVIFNYASQAHNNHFFINALSDTPKPLTDFSNLHTNLNAGFGSIAALRDLIRYTADGIFGSGFVWLVWARRSGHQGSWKVLATYNAGTPYVVRADGSADRTQGRDMNNLSAGSFGSHSASQAKDRPLGAPEEITPVLCLSVWEHSFIRDFSVHGKREYVDAWWECVDWSVVDARAPGVSKSPRVFPQTE